MQQVFDSEGRILPVTILKIPANFVVQIKDEKKDGYRAVQIGAGEKKRLPKPVRGHLKKAGIKENLQILREVRVGEEEKELKAGKVISPQEVFSPGDLVKVTGTSKGRGFAGVVKRWGFATQPKTHGQSDRERAPGSIGAQTPGRVWKGKKMPGHYGNQKVTVRNLTVVKVKEGEIWVKGAVPGPKKGWVLVVKTGEKSKRFKGLAEKDNDQENQPKDKQEKK